MTFKNRFSPREAVVSPVGVEPAQQQFKDDCDINSIMRRFQKTGAIDHVAKHQPQYGVWAPGDLHQALNIVAQAESMFADLPSSLRRRFNGDPSELLAFVQDPNNADEAAELGLALSDVAAAEAAVLAEERRAAEAVRAESGGNVSGANEPPAE